jgi:hypothetical protein
MVLLFFGAPFLNLTKLSARYLAILLLFARTSRNFFRDILYSESGAVKATLLVRFANKDCPGLHCNGRPYQMNKPTAALKPMKSY